MMMTTTTTKGLYRNRNRKRRSNSSSNKLRTTTTSKKNKSSSKNNNFRKTAGATKAARVSSKSIASSIDGRGVGSWEGGQPNFAESGFWTLQGGANFACLRGEIEGI